MEGSSTENISHGQVEALLKRYKDAYLVANTAVNVGSAIKAIGSGLGILIAGGAALYAGQLKSDLSFPIFAFGVLGGAFLGMILYLLGMLIAMAGQILESSLDGAVNSSPFLSNPNRATIMSLPG